MPLDQTFRSPPRSSLKASRVVPNPRLGLCVLTTCGRSIAARRQGRPSNTVCCSCFSACTPGCTCGVWESGRGAKTQDSSWVGSIYNLLENPRTHARRMSRTVLAVLAVLSRLSIPSAKLPAQPAQRQCFPAHRGRTGTVLFLCCSCVRQDRYCRSRLCRCKYKVRSLRLTGPHADKSSGPRSPPGGLKWQKRRRNPSNTVAPIAHRSPFSSAFRAAICVLAHFRTGPGVFCRCAGSTSLRPLVVSCASHKAITCQPARPPAQPHPRPWDWTFTQGSRADQCINQD